MDRRSVLRCMAVALVFPLLPKTANQEFSMWLGEGFSPWIAQPFKVLHVAKGVYESEISLPAMLDIREAHGIEPALEIAYCVRENIEREYSCVKKRVELTKVEFHQLFFVVRKLIKLQQGTKNGLSIDVKPYDEKEFEEWI